MSRLKLASEILKTLVVIAFAIFVLMLMGCATPLTEYERADRDILTREAYYRCQAAYRQAGWVWQTRGTRSAMDVKLKREPDPLTMRVEMMQNGCRR